MKKTNCFAACFVLLINIAAAASSSPAQPPPTAAQKRVLEAVLKNLGVVYHQSGVSGGSESALFVSHVYASAGAHLPARLVAQANVGEVVTVSDARLQIGDRLYFSLHHHSIDHVGVSLVGGSEFAHVSPMGHHPVRVDLLSGYYRRHLIVVRRSPAILSAMSASRWTQQGYVVAR